MESSWHLQRHRAGFSHGQRGRRLRDQLASQPDSQGGSPIELPEINEHNAAPGTPLNAYTVTYDRAAIEQYLSRSGEPTGPHIEDGKLTVPPGMFLGAYGRLIHGTFHYEAGVHTASQMTVAKCPPEGTVATVSGEVVKTFERNGDRYVQFLVVVSDEMGDICARVEHTSIYGLRSRA